MKQIEKLSESTNFSAVNIGNLNDLMDYSVVFGESKKKLEGKVFLKSATKSSGTEISFNVLPPQSEQPYFHLHRKNEETYIILSGFGFFQVDDECFGIKEGSVIRVAPQGKRGIYNSAEEPMTYIVIQSKENSLEEYTMGDGKIMPYKPKWR